MLRSSSRRAYALIVALGVALVLSAIALALLTSQSSMSSNLAIARRDLAQAILVHQAREGLAVRMDDRIRVLDGTSLERDFQLKYQDTTLRVNWKEGSGSVHRPALTDYGVGKNFFSPEALLPEASYHPRALVPALGDVKVPPAHTAVSFKLPGTENYQAVYSSAFPFAVCAPGGEVHLKSLMGFSNHSYELAETMPERTAYPAWVLAKGWIDVDRFPVGKALSALGPIHVSGGALGQRVSASSTAFSNGLANDLAKSAADITRGCLDKTRAIVGHVLSPQGLLNLISGRGDVSTIFSAQQATMMPFIPVPSLQTAGAVKVILLHSPWPADIREGVGDGELSERIRSRIEQRDKVVADRLKLRGEHARLLEQLQKDPDNPQAPRWKKQMEELRKSITKLQEEIDKLNKEIDILKKRLEESVWRALKRPAPRHAKEEATYKTWGASYLYIGQIAIEMLPELFKGNWEQLLAKFLHPTRLYHFGGRDPEWYYPDGLPVIVDGHDIDRGIAPKGWLSLKGTMTVPKGRTLRLQHPLQIRGNLWLQKGSNLHIDGHLELRAPADWYEADGSKIYSNDVAFPDGKLIIEEGATLRVDGNIKVLGGSPPFGSVLVAGPVDRVHPLTSAIFCEGSFSSRYGIHPAVNLEELFAYAARDNRAFIPGRDTMFHLSHLVPMLSRVIGPFEKRKTWFAEWATTTSVYIIKGIPVPVPTPMPQLKNCMRTLFDGLSWVASIQLNLRLGPYFYPQASLWPLGRGSTTVLLKTEPKLLKQILDPLQRLPTIDPKAFLPVLRSAILDIAKGAAYKIFYAIATKVLSSILKSKIPYAPVNCGLFSDKDTKKPPALEKFVRDVLSMVTNRLARALKSMFLVVSSQARRHYVGDPKTFTRELPGLLLFSEKDTTIGTSPADSVLASGLFISKGDLTFNTQRTIGTAISLDGDVTANDFFYYPFFSSASLYKALKPSEYGGKADSPGTSFLDEELKDMLFIGIPQNDGPAVNVKLPGARPIFQGWSR